MNASEHRARARAALKGQWVTAIITTLVYMLCVYGITAVSGLLTAIPLIGWVISIALIGVMGVFGLGYSQYCLNLVDHKPAELKDIFGRFDLLVPYLKVTLVIFVLFFVPVLVIALISGLAVALLGDVGFILMAIAMIAFCVFMILAVFGLALVNYVLLENPGMGARAACRQSWDLMNGNKFRYFCLDFSFIGWGILASFTFGLGLLALSPYMQVAFASFYRELVPGVVHKNENPQDYETYQNAGSYNYEALPESIPTPVDNEPSVDDSNVDNANLGDGSDDTAILTPNF